MMLILLISSLLNCLTILMVIPRHSQAEISGKRQTIFKKIGSRGGSSLVSKDIISSHNVHSKLECSMRCLKESKCVGYNWRKTKSNKYAVNCQLSNKTKESESSESGEWMFYQDTNNKNLEKEHSSLINLIPSLPQHKECFGYKWLTESNRNKKYTSSTNNCDRGLSGWYRFGGGAGIKMPTYCVPKYRCGTDATGWMNGAHPTVSDGKVTRKVCYNWGENCCHWSNNIEVVNCGQYYVYKLSRPSGGCWLRYCGTDNLCRFS